MLSYALRRIAGTRADVVRAGDVVVLHHPARARRPVRRRNRRCRPRSARISTPPTVSISRCSRNTGAISAGLAHGDLGPSFRYKDFRVGELIAERIAAQPNYRSRGGAARVAGRCAAGRPARHGARTRDAIRRCMGFSMLGVVLPGFVVGPLLALVFGIYWPMFRSPATSPAIRASSCCRSSLSRCRSRRTSRA